MNEQLFCAFESVVLDVGKQYQWAAGCAAEGNLPFLSCPGDSGLALL